MFKSVEYAGFDKNPEAKDLAGRATGTLDGIVRSWKDELQVTWRPAPPGADAVLELQLGLELEGSAYAATGVLDRRAFNRGEDELLRIEIRDVWLDLLDGVIERTSAKLKETPDQPVEV